MSVKVRMLIPMIITAIVAASLVLASNAFLFSRFIDSYFENNLERTMLKVLNEIYVLENQVAYTAVRYFSNDRLLVNAVSGNDNEALLARSYELFNSTAVDLLAVTNSSGRVIAQPNAPEFAELYLSAMPGVSAALAGIPVTTIEGGSTANMMISASAPIFCEQNHIIGTVIVGFRLDTDGFVDRYKEITGSEIAIFRGDECVATTLLNEDGSRALGMIVSEEVRRTVLYYGEIYLGEQIILNNYMLTKYIPVFDFEDNAVGILFAGRFLSERYDMAQTFIQRGVFITAAVLAIGTLPILFVSVRVTNPIAKKINQIYFDPLTGIYNRRYFDETLKENIESLSRSDLPLSLAMIDIDFFKKYNDTYGHGQGDECLKAVAEALKKAVAREGDFVARYGGEEFIVVLPKTGEIGANLVIRRLMENIHNCNIPHSASDISDRITVSIGVATGLAKNIKSGADLVKYADELLYKSKQNGRNQYILGKFDE